MLTMLPSDQAVTSHTALPCPFTSSSAHSTVPNIIQVLAEIMDLGAGIVADVVSEPTGARIAR